MAEEKKDKKFLLAIESPGSILRKLIQTEKVVEKEVPKEELLGKLVKKQQFIIENPYEGVEGNYFWFVGFMRDAMHLNIEKTSDVFTATEGSSFFGDLSSRRSILQEKTANYIGLIATMSKTLFQIVREVRILKERLSYYEDAKKYYSNNPKERDAGDAAEVALKSIWVDMVEGGIQNAGSVYGLASKVGFYTLPDFFFRVHAKSKDDVGSKVKNIEGINEKLKEVLQRKLYQYYTWKEKTYDELKTREKFTLKYLSQQYDAMKLYASWIKPYLRSLGKLDIGGKINSLKDPNLVTAFETSQIELELIATQKDFRRTTDYGLVKTEYKNVIPLIRIKFKFTTIPQMNFQVGYQKGPIHGGLSMIELEGYTPKKEDYEKYIEKKENEEFEIIKSIDNTLESLGDELKNYLREADNLIMKKKDEEAAKNKKEEEKEPGPFKALVMGFKQLKDSTKKIVPSMIPGKGNKEEKLSYLALKEEKKSAEEIGETLYNIYDVYKKSHGMLSW
ncbi:MAG: hypothetical protein PHE43_02405 [Candidatus Nanoarchaeia archaeon]|nr:hypothetical protein [Candidatus Nanoarchaeia archaeon]